MSRHRAAVTGRTKPRLVRTAIARRPDAAASNAARILYITFPRILADCFGNATAGFGHASKPLHDEYQYSVGELFMDLAVRAYSGPIDAPKPKPFDSLDQRTARKHERR